MIFFFLLLLCLIFTILYSCLHIRTPYDRQIDDRMQEEYLARQKDKKHS